jgi:hypothetical protein
VNHPLLQTLTVVRDQEERLRRIEPGRLGIAGRRNLIACLGAKRVSHPLRFQSSRSAPSR